MVGVAVAVGVVVAVAVVVGVADAVAVGVIVAVRVGVAVRVEVAVAVAPAWTFTWIDALPTTAPEPLNPLAEMVWLPLLTVVESQLKVPGGVDAKYSPSM